MFLDRQRLRSLARTERELTDRAAEHQRTLDGQGHSQPIRSNGLLDPSWHRHLQALRLTGQALGITNPFYRLHHDVEPAHISVDGERCLNFASYNYLGLNGHPRVVAAAKSAVDQYGTSCSGSRLVSGERAIHRELENKLATLHNTEDCVSFVSGHATNVTVIGNLLDEHDAVVHDALIHNSILQGAQLAGAHVFSFPHNDDAAAEHLLREVAPRHRRVLLALEGQYSMDGDAPNLPAFVDLARRFGVFILVDEAHSMGVLGARGRGLAEHFDMPSDSVDLWMGTLSKTFAGCGGYIACTKELAEYLRFSAPGLVYSVGMSPPVAAAAVAAIDVLSDEPERVARLRQNTNYFLTKVRAAGLNTGSAGGFSIVPIVTGSGISAARLSDALIERGVTAQPIFHPAVGKNQARLRFFFSSEHTFEQIDYAVKVLVEEWQRISRHLDFSTFAFGL